MVWHGISGDIGLLVRGWDNSGFDKIVDLVPKSRTAVGRVALDLVKGTIV